MKVTIADLRKMLADIPREHDVYEVVHLDYEYGYSLPVIFLRRSDREKETDMYVLGGGASRG